MRLAKIFGILFCIMSIGLTSAGAQSYSASYKFLKAIKKVDYREIKIAIEKGVNVNTRNYDDKRTPLVIAAQMKETALVNYLLQSGAKPDLFGDDGRTPLVIAAASGDKVMVAVLIKAGADLDLADDNGTTPLIAAVMAKKNQVVKLLLKKGADYELEDYSGRSPFQHAIDGRARRSMKLLKEAGATR